MSAHTTWYVTVTKYKYERIQVQAVTSDEAFTAALNMDDVVGISRVQHWSEVETNPSEDDPRER